MHTLKFLDQVHEGPDGINYTIRLGQKWNKRVNKGDYVIIDGKAAEVLEAKSCKFKNLPDVVYAHLHKSAVKRPFDLVRELNRAYEVDLPYSEWLEKTVTYVGYKFA